VKHQSRYIALVVAAALITLFQNCGEFQSFSEFENSSFQSVDGLPGQDPNPGNNTNPNPNSPPAALKNTWAPMSTVGAPSARMAHTSVWTGTEMIVFGGEIALPNNSYALGGLAPGGGIYNPSTNTWRSLTTTDAAVNRTGHTAVWTGSKMIVFGGSRNSSAADYIPVTPPNDGGLLNNGGIFDPTTNTWSPISTTGAPSRRFLHSAVWTGSKMIVWGGTDATAGTNLANGAAYDPVTNSWSPISTTNAPTKWFNDVSVWTGTKMIVWNGAFGGGSYDPATDSWTTIPIMSTAIGADDGHYQTKSMVWTGNELLIFPTVGAGSYSPTTGYTSLNAPNHNTHGAKAVWTGRQMVIIGQRSGWIYDSVSKNWETVSETDFPGALVAPRTFKWLSGHSAVWTGTQVLVWGGTGGTEFRGPVLNSGAILN
jgi:hypothetical protein